MANDNLEKSGDAASSYNPGWSYDTVVAPMERPQWIERVIMFCMPFEDPFTSGSHRTQLKPWVKPVQDAGFTLLAMYPDSFCRLWEPTGDEKWPAECREEVAAMHKAGIKELAGVYPFVASRGPRDILEQHPEWRIRQTDEIPQKDYLGCLISPFGDALVERLTKRIKEYDIDGYQFDGWYQMCYCRCDGCRALYKKDTGRELPERLDNFNPDYLAYNVWRDQKLFNRLVQLRKSVKAAKQDFVLINWNNNDAGGSPVSWMPESLDCVADWTNKEWWDAYDVQSVWLTKRLRGASGDRAPGMQPYMFMRWGKDTGSGAWHGSSCPMTEVLYRAHETMAMGGVPIIWGGARAGWTEADWERMTQDMVTFLPYVQETKSYKYALCIDSYSSLQNAEIPLDGKLTEHMAEKLTNHRVGMVRALLEEHIPFEIVSEHNVTPEMLAEYKVVILPNNFCMSDRLVAAVRDFVAKGGGVVATSETSLKDNLGKARGNYGLADVFAADYITSVPACGSLVEFTTGTAANSVSDDASMHDLMGKAGRTTYYGKYARVKTHDGAITPLTGHDSTLSASEKPEEKALAQWTPLVMSNFQKGRSAYFPAAMDAAYGDAGYPYERKLLANSVRWAAGADSPVKVTAPMCVYAGFYTKQAKDDKQVIVHLVNGINTTTGHGTKDDKEFAMREEVVPIHDIKVTFAGEKPEHIFLVPGNEKLKAHKSETGEWEVTVPKMEMHAVVVAEY